LSKSPIYPAEIFFEIITLTPMPPILNYIFSCSPACSGMLRKRAARNFGGIGHNEDAETETSKASGPNFTNRHILLIEPYICMNIGLKLR
jgi:hypothetical protein